MKSFDVGSLRAEGLVCEDGTHRIRHDLVKAPRPRLACDLTRTADGVAAKNRVMRTAGHSPAAGCSAPWWIVPSSALMVMRGELIEWQQRSPVLPSEHVRRRIRADERERLLTDKRYSRCRPRADGRGS